MQKVLQWRPNTKVFHLTALLSVYLSCFVHVICLNIRNKKDLNDFIELKIMKNFQLGISWLQFGEKMLLHLEWGPILAPY